MRLGKLNVADHHVSPGKKQWTWGNGDFGKAWDRNLTDEDELRASILNDWRYRDFYIRYQEYVERWRPCES